VFQSYALFGHMTVWDNVAFSLRLQNCGKSDLQMRVGEALQLVKMDSFARRYPVQLSGGQQQRVALARALVNRPTVMLLDEPLGALDLKLRKEMQIELSNLHRELGITFIMVTHDQEEALSLSDRIAVMNIGKVEQIGTPSEIYEYPKSPFVADFIGDTNLFQGQVEAIYGSDLQVMTDKGLKIWVEPQDNWQDDQARQVVVSVRPEKIHLGSSDASEAVNHFEGRLKHVHYQVELLSGDVVTVLQLNRTGVIPDLGTEIKIYWSAADCVALLV
jgi:spermidine/putrescine transport system ATP-binding protein